MSGRAPIRSPFDPGRSAAGSSVVSDDARRRRRGLDDAFAEFVDAFVEELEGFLAVGFGGFAAFSAEAGHFAGEGGVAEDVVDPVVVVVAVVVDEVGAGVGEAAAEVLEVAGVLAVGEAEGGVSGAGGEGAAGHGLEVFRHGLNRAAVGCVWA